MKTVSERNKRRIPINIWDDFYDDGHIPDGKIQETFAYIEGRPDLTLDEEKEALTILHDYIKSNSGLHFALILDGVDMSLAYYDSKIKYPESDYSYQRWELRFKNLTHKSLDMLMDILHYSTSSVKLKFKDLPIEIYSES